MVKYVVANEMPRVRFPDGADKWAERSVKSADWTCKKLLYAAFKEHTGVLHASFNDLMRIKLIVIGQFLK